MKGLRTIPAMLDIARDMERLCPGALLLNYTNPMAMLIMWAVEEATSVRSVGLCHSVQHTSRRLATRARTTPGCATGSPASTTWPGSSSCPEDGQDLYGRLRDCLGDPDTVAKDPVRFEIFRHFGYFVTESSRHMAEYVPYFLRHPGEQERLQVRHNAAENFAAQRSRREGDGQGAAGGRKRAPAEIRRSNEYAARIIHAVQTDTPYAFNGNVSNTGLITNLPDGCCVEVPCLVNRAGFNPAMPARCRRSAPPWPEQRFHAGAGRARAAGREPGARLPRRHARPQHGGAPDAARDP